MVPSPEKVYRFSSTCRSGEIGRRAGLKKQKDQICKSSQEAERQGVVGISPNFLLYSSLPDFTCFYS